MRTSPSSLVRRHRWGAGALLGVLGLLLNAYPIALTPGIDWLFGSVAYLLAAIALGPGPGVLAAAIASSRTIWLWDHPWAWLIFSLEALVVGYLFTRGNRRPLTADALFWILVGTPLLLLTYRGILGIEGATLRIIALKQPLNGLVNTVIVEALLLTPLVRRTLRLPDAPRLRTALAVLMLVASIIPALVFGVWAGRREWDRSVELATDRVEFAAKAYASKLEQYMLFHQQAVRTVAQAVGTTGDLSQARLQRLLAVEHAQFSGFLNMYIGDSRGTAIAFQPSEGRRGESLIGLDFSDRAYYRQLRETRTIVISEVFAGRGGTDLPMLAIAHPIIVADTFAGYVLGAIDLNSFPPPVAATAQAERMRAIDSWGAIVYDTRMRYRPGEAVRQVATDGAFAEIRADPGPGTMVYRPASSPVSAAAVASQLLIGYAPIPSLGWSVWAEHPFEFIATAVAAPYARLLALLVALVAAAAVFSSFLAAWLAAPLLRLRWAAASLAAGDRQARVRDLPASVPSEILELGRGFDEMADALAGRAEELEELSEIARSLASTLKSEELLRQVVDATLRLVEPDGCGIALLNPEQDTLHAVEYSPGLLSATANREIPLEGSLIGQVVRSGHPARITDVSADTHLYRAGIELQGIGSIICAPLVGRSGPLGALTAVRSSEHPPFTAEDLQLLERLARNAAIAVENARLIEAAQAASQAKSDFIAAMSHELRTPLNAVLGHLQLLEMEIHGPVTTEQRAAMKRIETATRHLRGLIEEVLSFARVEAGRVDLAISEVDLCALIDEVATVIEPLATQKDLVLEVELCTSSMRVHTDADKVRQILINLAGNAVKFTESGEVRISLEHARHGGGSHDGGKPDMAFVLRVADTGPGIPQHDQARLFRPFEQLESGLSRRHGGTGLGLYLSGRYAELLGGRIEVESEPGRGSSFSLMLPSRAPEEGNGGGAGGSGPAF
ncbi:MAG: GAF domain-containing protein [Gemmatimonadetes bacterium]|nr:GAF domain-containing protein [Gemmatimonadota bacterium]